MQLEAKDSAEVELSVRWGRVGHRNKNIKETRAASMSQKTEESAVEGRGEGFLERQKNDYPRREREQERDQGGMDCGEARNIKAKLREMGWGK